MSWESFEALEASSKTEGTFYQTGDDHAVPKFLEEILAKFFEAKSELDMENFEIPEDPAYQMLIQSDVDGQEILDTTLLHIMDAERGHRWGADFLLTPLIHILQRRGERRLSLSYAGIEHVEGVGRGLKSDGTLDIAYHLKDYGDDVHPLVGVMYAANHAGKKAEGVKMRVYGKVVEIGVDAARCSFLVDPVPNYMAYGAKDCSFYLASIPTDAQVSLRYADHNGMIDLVMGSELNRSLLPRDFIEKGNHFYIPDGKGWQEVRVR